MKHNPRCPFCGAPTRAQPLRDRTAYQCTDCAALCVGPDLAAELLLAMNTTPAGPVVRAVRPRGSSSAAVLTLALALVVLLLAIPVAVVVFDVVRERVADIQVAPAPEVPLVVTLPPAPVVVPIPLPEPVPEEPPPVVEPLAPAEPVAPRSARASVDAGWKRMDSDPAAAAAAFRDALAQQPGSADAQYGLGYALLQLGDVPGGTRYLCASLATAPADMRREVQSLLEHNALKCTR